MHAKRVFPMVFAWAAMVLCGGLAAAGEAKPAKADRGAGAEKSGGPERGGKGQQEKKKVKKNASGKALLGEKIKQNGKHAVGKLGKRTLTAEVQGGKVRNMAADDLAPKRVKSKQKMASLGGVSVASGDLLHFVQYGGWYYGYCFDDGYDLECYWYPEEEVYWEDYEWEDYDSYYY
jgi:hypothetical protein